MLLVVTIAEDVDLGVEVLFQTVLQPQPLALWVWGYGQVEEALLDNLVIVVVSLALVEEVDLQLEQRQMQRFRDEGKGFRRVLLF